MDVRSLCGSLFNFPLCSLPVYLRLPSFFDSNEEATHYPVPSGPSAGDLHSIKFFLFFGLLGVQSCLGILLSKLEMLVSSLIPLCFTLFPHPFRSEVPWILSPWWLSSSPVLALLPPFGQHHLLSRLLLISFLPVSSSSRPFSTLFLVIPF